MKPIIENDDPRLTAFLLGELGELESAQIQEAITNSPDLEIAVSEIRQMIGLLGVAYASESPWALLDEQKTELARAEIDSNVDLRPRESVVLGSDQSATRSSRPWLRIVLAASLLGLLVGGGWYLKDIVLEDGLVAKVDRAETMSSAELRRIKAETELAFGGVQVDGFANQRRDLPVPPPIHAPGAAAGEETGLPSARYPNALDGDMPAPANVGGWYAAAGKSELQLEDSRFGAESSLDIIEQNDIGNSPIEASQQSRSRAIGGGGGGGLGGAMQSAKPQRDDAFEIAPGAAVVDQLQIMNDPQQASRSLENKENSKLRSPIATGQDLQDLGGEEGGEEKTFELAEGERLEENANEEGMPLQAAEPMKKQGENDSLTLSKRKQDGVKKSRRVQTWKRVKAIPNTTRLMVGDKDELDLTGMQVNVQVDGFRARVLLDYFYYNNRDEQLEGNFKLRLPDDASLYYFAFGESAYNLEPKGRLAKAEFLEEGTQFVSLGADAVRKARDESWVNVKEAKMVPREKAAHAYRETVRRKIDPALVEWSGAGVFNARVFPLAPHKLHRIVIGYDVNLTRIDQGWAYELDLPEQTGQCQIDLNVQPVDGFEYRIQPNADPVENRAEGTIQKRFRFHGKQENGIQLIAQPQGKKVPEVLLHSSDEKEGDFWALQLKPELPIEKVVGSPVAIFMVDTSLSSQPDKFNVWLDLLRSTLTNNRDSLKHFNVLFFNVDGHFWQDGYVPNSEENVEKLMQVCGGLTLEGATDLYGAIETITQTTWVYESPQDVKSKVANQKPDLFLLSDGVATWGETNLRLMGRLLEDHQLGSMFAYQTGLTGTSIAGLRFLTGHSGGAVFSVTTESEIRSASMAHRQRPWRLDTMTATGATDTMTAGRVQWVYPGQSITVVGRGTVDSGIKLKFNQAENEKVISVSQESIKRVESELASRLYGQVAVGQLESLGAKVFDVAASYARHFRVTGNTCSLLMLETAQDYDRFGIKPEEDLFVIKSKVAKDLVLEVLEKSANELSDPKAQLVAWLDRLETMPGMSFKMPTALKLAMDSLDVVAISKPLHCRLTEKEQISEDYLKVLTSERLDYAKIANEATRRGATSIDEAIKVFSSLVERNPGDLVIARDVAFTAMEMDRPAQAYHLLQGIAKARPFQGSVYPALGQCLTQLGQADMAIVYYEVALGADFQRQGTEFKDIVSAEYMYLLRKIVSGEMDSSAKDFAKARLETMQKTMKFTAADVVITMMWNTDQTDVDLHVVEPSGEECSYENKRTRSNGQITSDITTGFGPEMYFNAEAPQGKYDVKVKYFANGQNRTELRNKVHLTIYRGFGTDEQRVDRRTIELKTVGRKESVATIGVD